MTYEKHKAVLMGNIVEKRYVVKPNYSTDYYWKNGIHGVNFISQPEIVERYEVIRHKEFLEFELDKPMLEIDEIIYVSEISTPVMIKNRIRSTTGEIIYYTEHELDRVEDSSATQKSLEEANKELEETLKSYNEYLERLDNKEEEEPKPKEKPWYLRIFE